MEFLEINEKTSSALLKICDSALKKDGIAIWDAIHFIRSSIQSSSPETCKGNEP